VWVRRDDREMNCTLAFIDEDSILCIESLEEQGGFFTVEEDECTRGNYTVYSAMIGSIPASQYALLSRSSPSSFSSSFAESASFFPGGTVLRSQFTSGATDLRSQFAASATDAPTSRRLLTLPSYPLSVDGWVWGSTDLSWLLSEAPAITQGAAGNGSLSLAVRPYVAGNLTLELWVEDDGGVERGGANKSGVVRFEVAVLPWNHRPTFGMATHHITILEDCVSPSHGVCDSLDW
jgi:hypothetical protein